MFIVRSFSLDVGSSSARMSVLVGENELIFGKSISDPRVIWTGPGTHTAPGPLESNWTKEGYLLIKDGTDVSHYVHPFNTLFNRDHSFAMRSQYEFDNRPNITGYQAFTLIDITSKYLGNLTASANSILGHNVTFAVIVLPDGQNMRSVKKEVINDEHWGNYTYTKTVLVGDGYEHSWSDRRVMNEASDRGKTGGVYTESYRKTSAAMFPFDNGMEYSQVVLVYRLGASAFEASIRTMDGGKYSTFSSVYDQHLGGNDFSQRVLDHLLLAHKNKTGLNLSQDKTFLSRLGNEVEKAKRALSTQDSVWIEMESSHPGDQGFSEQLSRLQFEELNMDLFNKTITAIDQVIKDSLEYTKDDIKDIMFSGGSTNIPYLQSAIREYFGHHKKYHGLDHPENNVVLGAARLGHWHFDEKHYNGNVCCMGEPRRTLGIETAGGKMFKFNTPRVTNKMHTFSTTVDNQDRVVIRIFNGDGTRTSENWFEGEVELTGITPAPKGVPQIRVRMSSYSCGRFVNLNVMDVTSGRINATIIQPSGPFYDDDDIDGEKIEYSTMLEGDLGLRGGAFEIEPVDELALR